MNLRADHQRDWEEWLETRPVAVREVAARLPPWHLYRVVSTDQRATIQSYDVEGDGTVTLSITAWYEYLPILALGVFGMCPDDLEIQEPFAFYSPEEAA